ncbi:MAG: efflux RND transporter periplasmic adaptor subunit [Bdellovibrionales bacterium]|nr:efflux RND transporter periplasmic adaptor subunit [Bdellovibrionales bacterium]
MRALSKQARLVLIFVLLILVYPVLSHASREKGRSATENIPTVMVVKALPTEISRKLSYPGLVEAQVHANILAETDGVIKNIHVLLGQKVKAGSSLLTLQQRDPIYRFAAVKTKSPVAGVVSQIKVTVGALVNKGQMLVSVTDPKKLQILVEIPAQDLQMVRIGLRGSIKVPALDLPLPLEIVGMSPSVDPATGTATAQLYLIKNELSLLSPGMIGKVSFKTNTRQGFLVPENTVFTSGEKTCLRAVIKERTRNIEIKTGDHTEGKVEVVSGLEAGMMVISQSSSFVSEGDRVQVETEKQETNN